MAIYPTMAMPHRIAQACVAGLVWGTTLVPTSAQPVEENVPDILQGTPGATLAPADVIEPNADPTPFGVVLRTLVVVDERAQGASIVPRGTTSGIDMRRAPELAQGAALTEQLRKLLGQPLSFRLLQEIQSTIQTYYQEQNQPLVSVSVPPQEISDGGLQVNVLSFQLGEKRVEGNTRVPDSAFTDDVRINPGDEVDSEILVEDLDWLALNPFRSVRGIFEPGSAFGTTNLILEVQEVPRWSAFAGLSNAGGVGTGRQRIFAGFNTDRLPFPDHQFAYQGTLSPSALTSGDLASIPEDEGYVSHAATYFAPLTWPGDVRTKMTVQAYWVGTFDEIDDFLDSSTEASSVSLELAFPMKKASFGPFEIRPDWYGRFEVRRQREKTFFLDFPVFDIETDIQQVYLGVRGAMGGFVSEDISSQGSFDLFVAAGQSDITFEGAGSHAYLNLSADQLLTFESEASLLIELTAQIGPEDLPSTDHLGIGGAGTVRGYETNELASQTAFAASIQAQAAERRLPGGLDLSYLPYGFFDVGAIAETSDFASTTIGSVGFGTQLAIGDRGVGVAEIGLPLVDGDVTETGKPRLHVSLVARF